MGSVFGCECFSGMTREVKDSEQLRKDELKEKLKGMKVVQRHVDAMQGLFDANLEMTKVLTNIKKCFTQAPEPGAKVQLRMAVVPASMPAEVLPEVKRIQKDNVAGLWEDSDKDGNGVLDQSECETLIQRYLAKSMETMQQLVEVGFDENIDVTMNQLRSTGQVAPDEMDMQREHLKQRFLGITPKVVAEMKRIHTEMMKPTERAAIAKELLETMDLARDGKVVKAEFEDSFIEMITNILGGEKLVAKMDLSKVLKNKSG